MNLEHIKAIITVDKVLLVNYGHDEAGTKVSGPHWRTDLRAGQVMPRQKAGTEVGCLTYRREYSLLQLATQVSLVLCSFCYLSLNRQHSEQSTKTDLSGELQ